MNFYVQLEDAKDLLLDRRSSRFAVQEYWTEKGFSFPDAFLDERPLGFVSRHLATARYEDLVFMRMCKKAGLAPIWSTYIGDKFIDRSPIKYSYLQPRVVTGFGRNESPIVRRLRLAEPRAWEGRPLDEIEMFDGIFQETLVRYHEAKLTEIYNGPRILTALRRSLLGVLFDIDSLLPRIKDFTQVYRACGKAKDYYPLLLSLAVAHGAMFEDFHGGESSGVELGSFTQRVFEPAFREVTELFGIPPLIVPLPWWKELGYYPSLELCRARDWRTHPVLREYRA